VGGGGEVAACGSRLLVLAEGRADELAAARVVALAEERHRRIAVELVPLGSLSYPVVAGTNLESP
jgi:hypothetical protein